MYNKPAIIYIVQTPTTGITLGRALAPLAHRKNVWRTLDPAGGHIGALLLETALKSVHSGP